MALGHETIGVWYMPCILFGNTAWQLVCMVGTIGTTENGYGRSYNSMYGISTKASDVTADMVVQQPCGREGRTCFWGGLCAFGL